MSSQKKYTSAVSFIIILVTIYWSISSLMPNKISSTTTPETTFSTERALVHLKEISNEAHYVGHINHGKVQDYIKSELEKLGLKVEIQNQVAINTKWRAGVNSENIITKIKGTEEGKSLLLLTHYDSAVHSAIGASDAGSGVVTILEGVRAFLASNPSPKNDIIIVFTDAEEIGLLGARAFVKHHPWTKNVGLAINFEARGSGGPSFMLMETNGGNKNMVKAFKQANPKYPVASSLLYSVYKMLPNDTDLTVFREDGDINGYNFAFIDDHFDYHTAQDSFERLDRNSLQHQAEYLMPLLEYFADMNLDQLNSKEDNVYFNFPGFTLIDYPFSWVLPMVIIAFIIFIALLIAGLKQKKLSLKEIFVGFIPFIVSLILTGLITVYGWKLLLKIYPQYLDILHGFTYNGHFYITAFVALTLGITLSIYKKYSIKYSVTNLSIAPIFIWILLNTVVALYLPGAGFFIIVVFLSLIGLVIDLFSKSSRSNKTLLNTFLSIPILIIFSPLIQTFPVGLGLKMMVISSILTVLVFSLLLPIIVTYKSFSKLNKLFFLIAILSLTSAGFTSDYSEDRKLPNSILYILDADKKEASWVSYDNNTDMFTRQFLGENPDHLINKGNVANSKYRTGYKLFKNTKVVDLQEPIIDIIQDTLIGDDHKITLKIIPQRKINRLEIISNNSIHIRAFEMNGEILKPKSNQKYVFTTERNHHVLSYYFTKENETLNLSLTLPKNEHPELQILEASYDLYTNPKIKSIISKTNPRSEIMMPMPFVLNDAIVIKKRIKL